jgi:hypothetical protein
VRSDADFNMYVAQVGDGRCQIFHCCLCWWSHLGV